MATNQVQDQSSDMETKTLNLEGQVPEEGCFPWHAKPWVKAALRSAIVGMLSMACQEIKGDGAAKKDVKTMILKGFTSLAAGACIMFLSVYSQYDINMEELPNPWQEAGASALAYAVGALVPLLGAAFVKDYGVRVGVVIGVVSFALFGLCALLRKAPVVKSSLRMLVGGWLVMGLTFGLTKLG